MTTPGDGKGRRIGIFGGAFNPPHNGHVAVARSAAEALGLDTVFWIPTCISPHKASAVLDPGGVERVELARAAAGDAGEALDIEIARGGISWSIDTIRALRARFPDAHFFFLMGEDALELVPQWKESEAVIAEVTFAVYPRRRGPAVADPERCHVRRIAAPPLEVSSTEVRRKLHDCEEVDALVPRPVLARIADRAHYTPPLSEGLRNHIRAVEDAVRILARRWSLDEGALALAARYHDAYRPLPEADARRILVARGEMIDEEENRSPILLHGRVAAARMEAGRKVLPVPDDAIAAVRNHTTGRAGMTPMEQALFLADRVGKSWKTADDVPVDRTEAMREAMSRKLAKLRRHGLAPHPRMREAALNYGIAL